MNHEKSMGSVFSKIDIHKGNMLMLAANQYPTLTATLLETVQNAIDSGAKHIWVKIDRKRRTICIQDNGEGASVEKFNQALSQVGLTMKTADKLGQFGLGLVAPIDKCERVTFTSCPKIDDRSYVKWTFDATKIKSQSTDLTIPCEAQPNLKFGKSVKTLTLDSKTVSQVDWRTQVMLIGYTEDRTIAKIGSIDDMAKEIFDRYGRAMHSRNILLTLEFTTELGQTEVRKSLSAPAYTGERLSEYIALNDGYRTFFRLYLARASDKGKSRGTVVLGVHGNEFRFPFAEFASRCREYLSDDVVRALKSGIFEGEILSTCATLHENRKQFTVNNGLVTFCSALETWYQTIGASHFDNVKDSRQGERYQQLGLNSMKNIEALLKTPRFEHLAELLRDFQQGNIGKEHAKSRAEPPIGEQEHTSKATSGGEGTNKPKSTKNAAESKDRTEPKSREDHHPHTVAGPKGQRRTIVSGGSLGLQFTHEKMPGETRLWVLDETQGILRFNIRHPTWASCDTSDKRIMQLQELVAIHAMQWVFCDDNIKEVMLMHINDILDTQVFLLLHSSSFNQGAPKKVEE